MIDEKQFIGFKEEKINFQSRQSLKINELPPLYQTNRRQSVVAESALLNELKRLTDQMTSEEQDQAIQDYRSFETIFDVKKDFSQFIIFLGNKVYQKSNTSQIKEIKEISEKEFDTPIKINEESVEEIKSIETIKDEEVKKVKIESANPEKINEG